jgi:hypothetical protein
MDVKLTFDLSPDQSLDLDTDKSLGLETSLATYGKIVATDYALLLNKPSIEGVELFGNKNFDELGLRGSESVAVSHGEISVSELTSAQLSAILTDD